MFEPTVSLAALPRDPALAPGERSRTHVVLRVSATRTFRGPRPRLTAVVVLDVSGSMQGEPLARAVQSSARIAGILQEGDSLGIVAFSSEARTVVPLRRLDSVARAAVGPAVRALSAAGNTNVSSALGRAALLFPPPAPDERQIALLLSDGRPNEGVATREGLAREVELVRSRGIALSTLGFGSEHDEDLLLALALAGGGRYAFVSDPLASDASFARALGAQRDVVAEDVRLVVSPTPGVAVARVLGEPRTSFGADGLVVHANDAILGEESCVVLELDVDAPPVEGPFRLLDATLVFRARGEPDELSTTVPVGVTLGPPAEPDHDVAAIVAVNLADELREEAVRRGDRRDFAGALEALARARLEIERTPGFSPSGTGPLADVLAAIEDDEEHYRRAPTREQASVYKKMQRDGLDLVAGSTSRLAQSPLSPSAVSLLSRVLGGPLPPGRLVPLDGGAAVALGSDQTLGRASDNGIVVARAGVSRRHVRVTCQDGAFWVLDLGTSNGTVVNGNRVARHRLAPGDVLDVGGAAFRFEASDLSA